MFLIITSLSTLSGLLTVALGFQVTGDPAAPRREESRRTLQTHLAKYDFAAPGELLDLKFKPLGRSYPSCDFFVLRFRRYPVEDVPPKPLKTSNVFAVCGKSVTLISDEQQLEKFFKANPPKINGEPSLADATKSWLYVMRELQKDGFYQFQRPVVSVKSNVSEGVVEVIGKRGDQGKLTVQMKLVGGKLNVVRSSADIQQGIRPRCQATRLLDKDPVVREIMRRDILVMGRACKAYLDEVRADASPELREAIDDAWQQIVAEGR